MIKANSLDLKEVETKSGLYKWYVDKKQLGKLLGADFAAFERQQLTKDKSDMLYYVYVGISKNSLRRRLNTHINGKCRTALSIGLKNSKLSAEHGSTLRRSIGSLLFNSFCEECISEFIGEIHVEFAPIPEKDLAKIEITEMKNNVLLLNIKDNKRSECEDFRNNLNEIRSKVEKAFIDSELENYIAKRVE